MLDFNPFKLFCLSDFIFIKIKFYKIFNLQKNVAHFKLEAQARVKRAFVLHYL
jgi:hypothetical protein